MKENLLTALRVLLLSAVAGFASPRFLQAASDCCETGHGPGCSDPVIEACVCAQDAWCCNVEWDGKCVTKVESLGCGTCSATEPSPAVIDLLLLEPGA